MYLPIPPCVPEDSIIDGPFPLFYAAMFMK